MTLDLSHPGESRVLTATLDGKLTRVTGPRELVGVVPVPSRRQGCALIPQGLLLADLGSGTVGVASGANPGELMLYRMHAGQTAPQNPISIVVDSSSGVPVTAAWSATLRGKPAKVAIAYSEYQDAAGTSSPRHVVVSVAGTARLTIEFDSFAQRPGFAESDFSLSLPPGLPHTHAYPYAGGQ